MRSADHAASWNAVPRGSSGTSKSVRVPAKYSAELVGRLLQHGVVGDVDDVDVRVVDPRVVGVVREAHLGERVVVGDERERADRAVDLGLVSHDVPLLVGGMAFVGG